MYKSLNYDRYMYETFGLLPNLFEIQIGYNLVPLVTRIPKTDKKITFSKRLNLARSHIDEEYGLPIPPIYVRDNMCLNSDEYAILYNGVEQARCKTPDGFYYCLDTGDVIQDTVDCSIYEKVKDPCFGIDGFLVPNSDMKIFKKAGYLCVSAEIVIVNHLEEIIKKNRTKILDQCMANQLIEKVRISNPDVVTDVLFTKQFTISDLKILLNSLLEEHVSIRDMNTIMETIADFYNCINGTDKKLWDLLIFVRERLAYGFIKKYEDNDCVLHAIKISDSLTTILHKNAISPYPDGLMSPNIALDPEIRKKVELKISESIKEVSDKGYQPVILCDGLLRHPLANFLHRSMPGVAVISDREVMTLKGDCVLNLEGEVSLE